jgi:hypothetical protein
VTLTRTGPGPSPAADYSGTTRSPHHPDGSLTSLPSPLPSPSPPSTTRPNLRRFDGQRHRGFDPIGDSSPIDVDNTAAELSYASRPIPVRLCDVNPDGTDLPADHLPQRHRHLHLHHRRRTSSPPLTFTINLPAVNVLPWEPGAVRNRRRGHRHHGRFTGTDTDTPARTSLLNSGRQSRHRQCQC